MEAPRPQVLRSGRAKPNARRMQRQIAWRRRENEPDRLLKTFLTEHCSTGPKHRVSVADLFSAFCNWFKEPVRSRWFLLAMAKNGFDIRFLQILGVRTKCFGGIALRRF